MLRWVRNAAVGTLILSMITLGVGIGLFLIENAGWIDIEVPRWFYGLFGAEPVQVRLPLLLAGWLLAVIAASGLLLWSMFYVWRRRQYEALIRRLERELAKLRNMPLDSPSPLEDLPELPDDEAAAIMSSSARAVGAAEPTEAEI